MNSKNKNESEIQDTIKNMEIKSENEISKDTSKISGIYKIINKVNGKYYVGSSVSVTSRCLYGHRSLLRYNKHYNPHLQKSWNKHGKENFEFVIVERVDRNELLDMEQKYLDIAKKERRKCYNISFTAGRPGSEWTKTKRKLWGIKISGKNNPNYGNGKKMRGRNNPMYGKGFLIVGTNNPNYGKGDKIRGKNNHFYGKGHLLKGKNNPNYGKQHSSKNIKLMIEKALNRNYIIAKSYIFSNSKTNQKAIVNNLKAWKLSINQHNWERVRETNQIKISKEDYFNKPYTISSAATVSF